LERGYAVDAIPSERAYAAYRQRLRLIIKGPTQGTRYGGLIVQADPQSRNVMAVDIRKVAEPFVELSSRT